MNWVDSKHSPKSVNSLRDNTEPSRDRVSEGVETRRRELTCRVCKTDKPETEFYKKDAKRIDSECKACRIIRQRERVLGVTQQQYLEMHKQQQGRCGICRLQLRSRRYKVFAVDHCHKTGRIRGLLCTQCNTAIGLLKDDPELFTRAAEWVKV